MDVALQAETTPLRLAALGADAVDAIREHARGVLAELKGWESTSHAVALDPESA